MNSLLVGVGISDRACPDLTPRAKVDGLEDAIAIIRAAWAAPIVRYHGSIYSVDDLDLEPKPAQPIPIWLGALGPRGLALTGRLADGWIPFLRFAGPDRIPELLDQIRTASVAAGLPADAVRAVYSVPVRLDPKARTTAGVIAGSAADITEQLHSFTELGFTGFDLMPSRDQMRTLAEDVVPRTARTAGTPAAAAAMPIAGPHAGGRPPCVPAAPSRRHLTRRPGTRTHPRRLLTGNGPPRHGEAVAPPVWGSRVTGVRACRWPGGGPGDRRGHTHEVMPAHPARPDPGSGLPISPTRRPATGGGDQQHPGAIMSTSINEFIGTFYEAVSGKAELLDAVITDDWDDVPLGPGQEPGRAGARSLIEGLNKVFSDLRIVVEEIIDARGEDGNGMVGVRVKMYGVHTGEFFGIAPTGRETEVRTHDFHQIVDGRIVRTHHMEDWVSWFQQVGSWPSN